MNSDLRQFVTQFLSVVVTTLMVVSLVAFLSIPYSLGGHPGDRRALMDQTLSQVQAPVELAVPDKAV